MLSGPRKRHSTIPRTQTIRLELIQSGRPATRCLTWHRPSSGTPPWEAKRWVLTLAFYSLQQE